MRPFSESCKNPCGLPGMGSSTPSLRIYWTAMARGHRFLCFPRLMNNNWNLSIIHSWWSVSRLIPLGKLYPHIPISVQIESIRFAQTFLLFLHLEEWSHHCQATAHIYDLIIVIPWSITIGSIIGIDMDPLITTKLHPRDVYGARAQTPWLIKHWTCYISSFLGYLDF